MFHSIRHAAIAGCLFISISSEAGIRPTDLSLPVIPKALELPRNGKIFSNQDVALSDEDGKPIETVATPMRIAQQNAWILNGYAPPGGFSPGQKVTVRTEREGMPTTVLITANLDEQAPSVPVLSVKEGSSVINITGDGLFYIIEDESGPSFAARSYFRANSCSPTKYRAIAVDEAGNRSPPSEWITNEEGLRFCPREDRWGCFSTGGEAAFGVLIAYAFRRLRRKQGI